jgi:N-acetylmuramic acid 6-phosphate etherase
MPLSLKVKRPTEHRNPASRNLDRMSTMAILRLMNREDRKVAAAVKREIRAIARATESIVRSIRCGGRVFYVGAGTSGRLAALDAAECPPTFGVSPRMVQALIAGGRRALTNAAEGAEDSSANGARELKQKNLSSRDVVVGISASGLTPYVIGALVYARKRGCDTIAVTSNRDSALARAARIKIAPNVGPEIIAGSSRLKAGTSQKLVLNMLSTACMVRLGHVYENLMIDVAQTNLKLRWRAVHILSEASGNRNVSAVTRSLRQSGRNLREALIMLKKGVTSREARVRLKHAGGNLRRALGE